MPIPNERADRPGIAPGDVAISEPDAASDEKGLSMARRITVLVVGILALIGMHGPIRGDEPPLLHKPTPLPPQVPSSPLSPQSKPNETKPNAPPQSPPSGGWFGCSTCPSKLDLQAGIGLYYLKPVWTTNPAFAITEVGGPQPNGAGQGSQQDFDYDYSFSPILWLGYFCENGLGVRSRWWHFHQSSNVSATNFGGQQVVSASPLGFGNTSFTVGDQLLFQSALELSVWDLEVTQGFRTNGWSFAGSVGVRYVHLAQDYFAGQLLAVDTGVDVVTGGHNFNGLGPTICLEARRYLSGGCSVYATARGALLLGEAREQAFQVLDGTQPPAQGSVTRDTLLPVGEIEIGFDWSACLGLSRVFVQGGLTAQGWFGAGNSSNNGDLIGTGPFTYRNPDANSNLGFFGVTIAAGLRY